MDRSPPVSRAAARSRCRRARQQHLRHRRDPAESSPRGIFPEVEAYDQSRDTWEPRHGIGAAAVCGRIYIPGGAPIEGFATTDVHDAFVPRELAGDADFRRADANLDTLVDISDAVLILIALFTGEAEICCEDGADSNDDGKVDISDAAHVLAFLFQGGATPPAPGPKDLGPDPTEDEIGCTVSVSS